MEHLVYLDNAATTPLHSTVLDAMLPYLTTSYGNPSATYGLARAANEAVQSSRRTVAGILGSRATEVVFTGDDAAKMQRLLDALENIDDVQEVYTTAVLDTGT